MLINGLRGDTFFHQFLVELFFVFSSLRSYLKPFDRAPQVMVVGEPLTNYAVRDFLILAGQDHRLSTAFQ